jgi:hypothetical protein
MKQDWSAAYNMIDAANGTRSGRLLEGTEIPCGRQNIIS